MPVICPFWAVLLSEQPLFPDAIGSWILPDPQRERPLSSPALVAISKLGEHFFWTYQGFPDRVWALSTSWGAEQRFLETSGNGV